MDAEHTDSKNDIMQNQEEAMEHLIKAVRNIDQSNEKVSNEYTEQVRLEVEKEGQGKTEAIEKLDNRLSHLEAILKEVRETQHEIQDELNFQKVKAEPSEQEETEIEESQEENRTRNYDTLECGVCGRELGVKGFAQHVKAGHGINVREMFRDGDLYKAAGKQSDDFERLSMYLNKDPSTKNITEILAEKLKQEDQTEESEATEKYTCDICGETYGDKRGVAGHLGQTHGLSGDGVVDKNIREPSTDEMNQQERKEADREGDYECPYCEKMVSKHAISRHLKTTHSEETGMRGFYWDDQKNAYCHREEDIEESNWLSFRNRFGGLDYTPTELLVNALHEGFNSEQEMYEKKNKATEDKEVQAEPIEEETQDNISDYERAKRKASVSDRDMEIAEKAIHKIIHDHLDNIPDSNEKFISYTGNENIPGFETLYAGDLGALNMWRKIFSNTGLLTGINERVAENHDLSWERKGSSGTPKNWVIKVERNDR